MINYTIQPSATIAGQIIKIFEDNKLTIAQAKQVLIDVENALGTQKVRFNIQNNNMYDNGAYPEGVTMGIVDYEIMA